MTGGIAGALIGPSTAAAAKDLFPDAEFAGVYVYTGAAFSALLAIFCVPGLVTFPIKAPGAAGAGAGPGGGGGGGGGGDPLLDASKTNAAASSASATSSASAVAVAYSQPSCCAATAVAALSYAAMAFLMSPTPLAMKAWGFSFSRVSHVIMVGLYVHVGTHSVDCIDHRWLG